MRNPDTIIALATPPGTGAIAVIRLSGPQAIAIADARFRAASGKELGTCPGHTVQLGSILKGERELDEVLVTVFKGPRSYTGEDVVEISCHGSPFIQQEILQLFLEDGCRMANPGEFTLRAFLAGKMDLSQAEAVADLIASENRASHQLAMDQMRGGYSSDISELRERLVHLASMLTLELDFSGEDVEFADRSELGEILEQLASLLKKLIDSFALGNVIKRGVPVAIAGAPNVGKSTLLNALLREERAIVSEIAGTTRDAIEDEIVLDGVGFRFIDTAGIRETADTIERVGISRTFEKIGQARILIYMLDAGGLTPSRLEAVKREPQSLQADYPDKPMLLLVNKMDLLSAGEREVIASGLPGALFISAKTGAGIPELQQQLLGFINRGLLQSGDPVVSNSRHYEALLQSLEALERVREGLAEGVPGDLVSVDINDALFHLGVITGKISTDDLLANIFSNFCIGK